MQEMENEWLTYAKRLQASALTGLAYCKDRYDIERYQEIKGIADEMFSKLFMAPVEQVALLEPVWKFPDASENRLDNAEKAKFRHLACLISVQNGLGTVAS
ncbi:NUDIX hydrolase N-terminal domain-containing protein [Ralstonia nicotianae]